MKGVLITGGSGLVGQALCENLLQKGFEVRILSTKKDTVAGLKTYHWNIQDNQIEEKAFDNIEYIIHLAGANIGERRWTKSRKQQIIDSRVKSAQLIFDVLKKNKKSVSAYISASAIGYYGSITSEKIFNESDPPSEDFLGNVCKLWEESADKFSTIGIRTVKIRTGVVLTRKGGVLSKMIVPTNLGLGSGIGDGKQYLPWIHIEDLSNIYLKAIQDEQMHGSYNAVAPDYKTNYEFSQILAMTLKKPFWFPNVPAQFLILFFGEMANMLLKGSRVSSAKIISIGFSFQFSDLKYAINNLLTPASPSKR